MRFLSLSLCVLFIVGCAEVQRSEWSIAEITYQDVFHPPGTWLNLNDRGVAQSAVNQELVKRAIVDGRRMGLDLVFVKAINAEPQGCVLFVFEVQHHDDLFYIYVSDVGQNNLTSKFRFSDS